MGAQDCFGEIMGEITYMRNGVITTIHTDGSQTTKPTGEILCDGCNTYQFPQGGKTYKEQGETVLWLCVYCK